VVAETIASAGCTTASSGGGSGPAGGVTGGWCAQVRKPGKVLVFPRTIAG
jgi:hypothetical protein